jgi:FixJ family two-component response regulator
MGASGYLQKEAMADDLVGAIRTVVLGRKYVSQAVAQLLATDIDMVGEGPLHGALSEREFEIFCRLARGQGATSIADDLSLSVKTVSTYRTRHPGEDEARQQRRPDLLRDQEQPDRLKVADLGQTPTACARLR